MRVARFGLLLLALSGCSVGSGFDDEISDGSSVDSARREASGIFGSGDIVDNFHTCSPSTTIKYQLADVFPLNTCKDSDCSASCTWTGQLGVGLSASRGGCVTPGFDEGRSCLFSTGSTCPASHPVSHVWSTNWTNTRHCVCAYEAEVCKVHATGSLVTESLLTCCRS